MAEEVRFFARLAVWGVGAGVIYWLLTSEPVGTVVLIGFGGGTGFLAVAFGAAARRVGGTPAERPWRWIGLPRHEREIPPLGDESGRLPAPTLAPIAMGLGVALGSLGLVLGPWLFLAAVLPLAVGGRMWLRGAVEEHRAAEGEEPRPGDETVRGESATASVSRRS